MKRSTWIALGIVLLVVAGLCLACLLGAVLVLGPGDLLPGLLGQENMLLLLHDRAPSSDLALLRFEQPLEAARLLAQDVEAGSALLLQQQIGLPRSVGDPRYGGFVRGTSFLLIQYEQDGEIHLERVHLRTGQQSPILESTAALRAVVHEDGSIFLVETTGTRQRCYRWRPGGPATRLARGDECLVTPDGSTLVVADRSARGLTLTASRIDGSEARVLLDDEEGIDSFRLSADGSRLAFVRASENERQQLVVLDRHDASIIFESSPFVRIADYDFSPGAAALYFVAETDDVDLVLYALDGEAHRVAQGPGLAAAFSPKGNSLVYLLTDEEGKGALFVHPMEDKEETEVVRGENLSFAVLPSPGHILILDQIEDELTLYSADVDGLDLVELFSGTGLAGGEAFVIPGEPWLYLLLTDLQGERTLYFSPLDRAAGRVLLQDFHTLRLLHRSPRASSVLIATRHDPDDQLGLYLLPTDGRSEPVLLDDNFDDLLNAAFTRGGRQVIYTAVSEPDGVEVRRQLASGRQAPETLHPAAGLLDIQWDRLTPFSEAAVGFRAVQMATSLCPGAEVIHLGQSVEGMLSPGEQGCYRLQLSQPTEAVLGVRAESGIDLVAAIHDRAGTLIAEDDDSGPGLNPRLHLSLDTAGSYFVVIRGYSAEVSGRFTLSVTEHETVDPRQTARSLPTNERVRGIITSEDELYLEPYDTYLYGILYSFVAQADDWVEIEVRAGSIGSALRPVLLLLDESLETMAVGESDAAGDVYLAQRIPQQGRYFVLVSSTDEDYGREADYAFDIRLSIGTPPEPSGGPIEFGQTVEGMIQSAEGDRWMFEGRAGDLVSIRMESERLDCYLELLDPAGLQIASDDDSGGNLNAFLNGIPLRTTGTYTIVARGYSGRTGPYTLSLTLGRITPGGGTITRGQAVSGVIVLADGDEWTFEGTAGQSVTISLSGDFDTYLELRGPDGQVLITDDDSGGNLQARISDFRLPRTGTYTIVARSFGRDVGLSYTLRLE